MDDSSMMTLSMKKDSSGWYLFKAIVGLLFSFLLFYPAIPKLVLMFVDYPTLEQATIIEGTLHVEQSPYRYGGRRSSGGMPDPTNYVIDAQGVSHKIFWRIKGDGHGIFYKDYEGLRIKVWFHTWYGVVQGKYEEPPELTAKLEKKFPPKKWGKEETTFDHEYNKVNALRAIREFKMVEYNWGLLIFISVFIYTIYCFKKYFKIKRLKKVQIMANFT